MARGRLSDRCWCIDFHSKVTSTAAVGWEMLGELEEMRRQKTWWPLASTVVVFAVYMTRARLVIRMCTDFQFNLQKYLFNGPGGRGRGKSMVAITCARFSETRL